MKTIQKLFHAVTREKGGGIVLLLAALIALIWANSSWAWAYFDLANFRVGPASLHLDLTLSAWAGDGLLAIFFFVVGLELKHELAVGSLRNPRQAAVPVLAAVGGVMVPALIFIVIVTVMGQPTAVQAWAIPTATDIAFALAVLAIFGAGLPKGLRTFLLTLAVVDDLLAIVIIAFVYTGSIDWLFLGFALIAVLVFLGLSRTKRAPWPLLLVVALVAWVLMHESGIHATIAGVLLGVSVPARAIGVETLPRTKRYERAVRPLSSGIALPVFAFFAAGVAIGGSGNLLLQPVAVAIIVGLVLGKLIGVMGTAALLTWLTPLRPPGDVGIRDLLPVGFLTGIGFTVSLLIADLALGDAAQSSTAKLAVLVASTASAGLAIGMLRWDVRARARG